MCAAKLASGIIFNTKVREAMSTAVDRASICKAIASKAGSPATNMIAPGVFGFDDTVPAFEYDMEKAKQLMQESAYSDGFALTALMSGNQLNSEIVKSLRCSKASGLNWASI